MNLQKVSQSRGQSDERSASVQNGTSVIQLSNVVTQRNGVEVNLPVGLTAEGDGGQLALVVVLVNTTKGSHRAVAILVGIAKVESKHGLINLLLVHHVVERRDYLVDGDGVIAQTQDTVELTEDEGKAGLLGCLSEVLVLNLDVTNLDGVLRHETTQATRSVSDGEFGAVLLVGRRRRGLVLVVKETGDGAALRRRHPQVGATRVQNDLELLGRSTDFNLREI